MFQKKHGLIQMMIMKNLLMHIKKNKKMLKKMIYAHTWFLSKIFQDINKKQAEDKIHLLEKSLTQNI